MARKAKREKEKSKRQRKIESASYRYSAKYFIASSLRRARSRAKKLGVEFSLTREWLEKKMDGGCCEVTGIYFEFGNTPYHSFLPSLDRIDSSGGYTPDNVQVVVLIYNRAKGPDSHADIVRFATAVLSRGVPEHFGVNGAEGC